MDRNSNYNNPTDINETKGKRLASKVIISMSSHQMVVAVLVESNDNKKLFGKILHQSCHFYAANGWEHLIEALEIVNSQRKDITVIGIIDADFRRISGEIPVQENLFMTDYHDTEIMIVCSDAWENINVLIDKEKIQVFEKQQDKSLRDFLLDLIRSISVLRWLNYKDNLGLTFKVKLKDTSFKYIDYESFIDRNYKISIDDLLKAVENKSQKQGFFKNYPEIKQNFEDLCKTDFDLKEITNGHDFMNVLVMILKIIAKNTPIEVAEIETNFIFGYHLTDFQKTNLHKSLAEWETQKQGFKVLRLVI